MYINYVNTGYSLASLYFQYENDKLFYMEKTRQNNLSSDDSENEDAGEQTSNNWRLVVLSVEEQERLLNQFHSSSMGKYIGFF